MQPTFYQPQMMQQPMNMYQPGMPQPMMMQQQQPMQGYYQQPQQMVQQPQQAALTPDMAKTALATYVQNVAASPNANVLSKYMYSKYATSQWTDAEFGGAGMIAFALAMATLQRAPGLGVQQALSQAIPDAYEVNMLLMLQTNPQIIQQMPQDVFHSLLGNIPRLQQALNQAMPLINAQPPSLAIQGYQVQQVTPAGIVPMQQQQASFAAPMQQQYGIQPQQAAQSPYAPRQQSSSAANLGYSNARAVIPPAGGENHFGVAPVTPERSTHEPLHRSEKDRELGITARQMDFGGSAKPAFEPMFKTPVQTNAQRPAAAQPQMQQAPQQPAWNGGVQEQYSTPTLQQAISQQLTSPTVEQMYPSDISFDDIASLASDEEAALFNPPPEDVYSPMPSMTELFGSTFGANKAELANLDSPTYTQFGTQASAEAMVGQAQLQPSGSVEAKPLSTDGLPDGWLYTEAHYEASSEDFFNLMRKSKRNRNCPWPIAYDRRYCTRLYRVMDDGSIEQKIVGVPMDRLKHDISLLDTPVPTDEIYAAEQADFGKLAVMPVNEAVKIVKDPETTPEVINEKLEDKDIFVVDKPILALCRQEAMMLAAATTQPLINALKEKHGFETQVRECVIVTQRGDADAFMSVPEIKALSRDSEVNNIMELSEAIRAVRHAGLLNDRALNRITEHMREVINNMLYADYGYAGELELTADQPFEDELVDFVLYMQNNEDDMDVLTRINKPDNWGVLRSKLCALLTGDALHNVQQQLARRYKLSTDMQDSVIELMKGSIILEKVYSITTVARTTKQLRISDNRPAFVTMQSERPYLYKMMADIKKRCKATGAHHYKHLIVTAEGVELAFAQAGLGRGDTFPTYYV